MTSRTYTLTEELRAELYETLTEVYEGCQNITGPQIPLEVLLKIFKEPIIEATTVPAYRSDAFTDEERETMFQLKKDEINDCLKDYAIDELEAESLVELMCYVDPDAEVTLPCL